MARVKCDKCGAVEVSGIAGKQHRRCTGQEVESTVQNGRESWPIRPKGKKLPRAMRGVWR